MSEEADRARSRIAAALRGFAHTLVDRELETADVAVIDELAVRLEGLTERLDARALRYRDVAGLAARLFARPPGANASLTHFDECYVSGEQNPVGFALDARLVDGAVVADLVFARAFGVASGHAHGGAVAAVLDDVLGYAVPLLGEPAFTGELTVRYLAPVPTKEPVRVTARVTGRHGRKIFAEADLVRGDEPLASARATFITVSPKTFLARHEGPGEPTPLGPKHPGATRAVRSAPKRAPER